jgi:CRP-like cAMP-binding protein
MAELNNSSFNKLLRILSPVDYELLRLHLEPIELKLEMDLEIAHEQIAYAYFLDSGVASSVGGNGNNGRPIEVGLTGREGVTALPLILGNHLSMYHVYMQVAGHGQRIAAKVLRDAIAASPTLHGLLLKFVQVFMLQLSQERLSRWILMASDRLDGPELPLTHEFLAVMLGVRRAGVTDAVHALEGRGLIKAARGCLWIVDRDGLIEGANGCYGMPEREYRRLIGPA